MLTLWKGPPISLEFPSPSTNTILQSHLERGKNGDLLVRKCAFTPKIKNHKPKNKITRKQIYFLLFDAFAFVPKSLKHLIFQWSLKISFISVGTFTLFQKQPKGRGRKRKDKRKIWGKFYQNIKVVFHLSPKLSIHRHFNAIVGASGQTVLRTVGKADHCWAASAVVFLMSSFALIKSIGFFGFSKLPVEKALKQLPALPEALLTEYTGQCVLISSLGCTFHSPPPTLLFSFSKLVKLRKDCAQRIPCSTQKHTHHHRNSSTWWSDGNWLQTNSMQQSRKYLRIPCWVFFLLFFPIFCLFLLFWLFFFFSFLCWEKVALEVLTLWDAKNSP